MLTAVVATAGINEASYRPFSIERQAVINDGHGPSAGGAISVSYRNTSIYDMFSSSTDSHVHGDSVW
jgi:hypothetical protein